VFAVIKKSAEVPGLTFSRVCLNEVVVDADVATRDASFLAQWMCQQLSIESSVTRLVQRKKLTRVSHEGDSAPPTLVQERDRDCATSKFQLLKLASHAGPQRSTFAVDTAAAKTRLGGTFPGLTRRQDRAVGLIIAY